MKSSPLAYDVAYGCYFLIALIVLALMGLRLSMTEAEWRGGGAILFVLLPLIVMPVIATIVGVLLSIHLWEHWPLRVLAGSTLLLVTEPFMQLCTEKVEAAGAIVYGVGVGAASPLVVRATEEEILSLEWQVGSPNTHLRRRS
jgi:hypothetical protein